MSDLSNHIGDNFSLLRGLSKYYLEGFTPDWNKLTANSQINHISLPTYPFLGRSFKTKLGKSDTSFSKKNDFSIEFDKKQKKANISKVIANSLSQILEMEQNEFDWDIPFTEFGIDSVFAVEVIEKINSELTTELRTTDLFNFSTINVLADHIDHRINFIQPQEFIAPDQVAFWQKPPASRGKSPRTCANSTSKVGMLSPD